MPIYPDLSNCLSLELSRKDKIYSNNGKESEYDIKRNALIEVEMLTKEYRKKLTNYLKTHISQMITEEDPSLEGKADDVYISYHNEITDCNYALKFLDTLFEEVSQMRL